MATAKVVRCSLFEDSTITLALFKNVRNAGDLKKLVMNGAFQAALINPNVIIDPFQVLVSANKAIHSQRNNRLITKTVHTEIIYGLSPSKNISDSFRKFGMGDNASSVLVVILDDEEGKTLKTVTTHIQGELADIEEVSQLSDMGLIKKIYKLTEAETTGCSPLDAIVSRIASKEIVTV